MIDRIAFPALRALGWLALIYFALIVGPELEGKVLPVIEDFRVAYAIPQGDDVLIGGTLSKARNCNYIEPWRARVISTGKMLHVRTPDSDKANWPKSGKIEFAPIIVVGAGGEKFELWAEHECHPLWHTMTLMAEVQVK